MYQTVCDFCLLKLGLLFLSSLTSLHAGVNWCVHLSTIISGRVRASVGVEALVAKGAERWAVWLECGTRKRVFECRSHLRFAVGKGGGDGGRRIARTSSNEEDETRRNKPTFA